MARYYPSIENLYKKTYILEMFKYIWALEKVHGCLYKDVTVKLADGSRRRIKDIVKNKQIGLEILGEIDGVVVTTQVTNVFNNGGTKKWLRIRGTRRKAGQGPALFNIKCTPNHKFKTDNGYVKAEDLTVGTTVYTVRNDLELTYVQKQTLLGKMLGDGSFVTNNGTTAEVHFGHKKDHEEYLNWCLNNLGNIAGNKRYKASGYGTAMVGARTTRHYIISEYLQIHLSLFVKLYILIFFQYSYIKYTILII